ATRPTPPPATEPRSARPTRASANSTAQPAHAAACRRCSTRSRSRRELFHAVRSLISRRGRQQQADVARQERASPHHGRQLTATTVGTTTARSWADVAREVLAGEGGAGGDEVGGCALEDDPPS